jgi:hypothetical protein
MENEFDKKCITETLEEAAERLWLDSTSQLTSKNSFIQGGKWMQERMYSEEDMRLSFETGRNFQLTGENNFNELIDQFKKTK